MDSIDLFLAKVQEHPAFLQSKLWKQHFENDEQTRVQFQSILRLQRELVSTEVEGKSEKIRTARNAYESALSQFSNTVGVQEYLQSLEEIQSIIEEVAAVIEEEIQLP
ncbi:MAG: YlbF family regulator [Candidatus Izemoplasmatales bacterium]|nr:YlbF family regulator [Candidatus Izemoplasmatales bacterium]